MRREFIYILSGIIIVSTLTSLLANDKQTDPEKVHLVTVAGAVGPGDYAYWYIGHYGRLVLELNSLTGDADLYVSEDTRLVLFSYQINIPGDTVTPCYL